MSEHVEPATVTTKKLKRQLKGPISMVYQISVVYQISRVYQILYARSFDSPHIYIVLTLFYDVIILH